MTAKTVSQLCNDLKFSERLFWNLLKRGEGPIVTRIGRRVLITAANEAAWLKSREVPKAA